jgi:ketol-acid reductoisomerase
VKPVFDELYEKVASGEETKRVIEANSRPNYQEELAKELAEIRNSEMWQAGATVRSLRPQGK